MDPVLLSQNLRRAIADLPFISGDLPGIGGVIKAEAEHFQVQEVLPYTACGEGEHLYVTLQRKGWNTADVAHALARAFRLKLHDVGYGGRKDKHAVTTQTFSLPLPMSMGRDNIDAVLATLPFNILEMKRHRNKIKTGHVAANRFKIVMTQVDADGLPVARSIVEALIQRGVPNFFGEQRFGHGMRNLDRAATMVTGNKRARGKKETFLVSAFQGALFNIWLKERMEQNVFNTIMTGDIAKKTDTGGMFEVEDIHEAEKRFKDRKIIYTGPVYGHKMKKAAMQPGEVEQALLDRFELDLPAFKRLRAGGSRRPAMLLLDDLTVSATEAGLAFSFSLPSGAYATTVMREFMRPAPIHA